jgi:hypothetical protein
MRIHFTGLIIACSIPCERLTFWQAGSLPRVFQAKGKDLGTDLLRIVTLNLPVARPLHAVINEFDLVLALSSMLDP